MKATEFGQTAQQNERSRSRRGKTSLNLTNLGQIDVAGSMMGERKRTIVDINSLKQDHTYAKYI